MIQANWVLCHGHSDRCLSIWGYDFPLCARCTAIYFGLVSGLAIELIIGLFPREFLIVYLIMILPTGVDGLTQLMFNRESTNFIRCITGYPAGVGLMLFIRTVLGL